METLVHSQVLTRRLPLSRTRTWVEMEMRESQAQTHNKLATDKRVIKLPKIKYRSNTRTKYKTIWSKKSMAVENQTSESRLAHRWKMYSNQIYNRQKQNLRRKMESRPCWNNQLAGLEKEERQKRRMTWIFPNLKKKKIRWILIMQPSSIRKRRLSRHRRSKSLIQWTCWRKSIWPSRLRKSHSHNQIWV